MTYMPLIQQGFSYTLFTTKKCFSDKVSKHQNIKCDSVPSECLKSCFFMYPIRNLIAIMETTNATTIPTIRIITSVPVKEKPNFRIFRRLAPNMTGIPRKKVNSAATVREVPARIPPIMVEPERDVPGTTESTWNRPMMSAVLNDRFSRFVQVGLLLLL